MESSSSSQSCSTCEGSGRVPVLINSSSSSVLSISSSSSSALVLIVTGPSDRTVVAGRAYTDLFSVSVVSSDLVEYAWQHSVDGGNVYFNINPNGGVFSGANSPTLGVYAGMTDFSSVWNGAMFRCVVRSAGATLTSNAARLTVVEEGSSSSQTPQGLCENECFAIGEVPDENCVCTCDCPEGQVNTGVAFAPNGETICECLFSSTFMLVVDKSQPSSSDGFYPMASGLNPSCLALEYFDPDAYHLHSNILFASEGECLDSLSDLSDEDSSSSYSSSSSIEDARPIIHSFIEVSVASADSSSSSNGDALSGQSSANGVELITVETTDGQFAAQVDFASRRRVSAPPCNIFSHEEPCPEGYYFSGFAGGCEGENCEKICCMMFSQESDSFICGAAHSGSKPYNAPWDFYLEPESLSLVYGYALTGEELLGLTPSEINQKIGTEFPEGTVCCFPVVRATRKMNVSGPTYCYPPLSLYASRTFDDDLGEFVQTTECRGECEDIFESWCLDSTMEEFDAESQAVEDEIDQEVSMLSYQELVDLVIGGILDEEIQDALQFQSSSSSSTEYPDIVNVAFDAGFESIPADPNSPRTIVLRGGVNLLISRAGGAAADSYFSFDVPPDMNVAFIRSLWGRTYGSASVSMAIGHPWGGTIVGSDLFGSDNDRPFASLLPLAEDQYSIKISHSGDEVEYALLLVLENNDE